MVHDRYLSVNENECMFSLDETNCILSTGMKHGKLSTPKQEKTYQKVTTNSHMAPHKTH